ncbi:MAG TPA: radical SAM family heme chaperone HemW [Pyrinomonadaceae bacterium]|nr:radical SAM family heme chaperone HemW [Pyrinomonadaceae bacterium]
MNAAGLYIHIPFCRSRCSYCDFATGLYESSLAERYVRALVTEIKTWNEVERPHAVDTIYFGGGTPSLLSAAQLGTILAAVQSRFNIAAGAEVTLEMNPGTVTREVLREFRGLGVNRASFGAQTFDDNELARLGRSHSAKETLQTFDWLREAGFENVSFDLIAGLPGQSLTAWRRNLERSLALRPEHLSFYLLEVHEGTPLAEHIRTGKQPSPNPDLAGQMYELMLESASAAGYEHYEISNLCRPGRESRHNTKYWNGAAYYGFGCSAHSYDGERQRWANERNALRYIEAIEQQLNAVAERTELTRDEARAEAVFLGLRLMRGLNTRQYQNHFGIDLRTEHESELKQFQEAGLVEFEGDVIRLTPAGALLSNEVFSAFV